MEVILNYISGFEDAFTGLYTSRLVDPITNELRDLKEISQEHTILCDRILTRKGTKHENVDATDNEKFDKLLYKVVKIGKKHITLLRFINFSFTVTGIHRGAQD